jgi:hypothetical protein
VGDLETFAGVAYAIGSVADAELMYFSDQPLILVE